MCRFVFLCLWFVVMVARQKRGGHLYTLLSRLTGAAHALQLPAKPIMAAKGKRSPWLSAHKRPTQFEGLQSLICRVLLCRARGV